MKNTLSLRYAKAFIDSMGEDCCQSLLQMKHLVDSLFLQEDFLNFLTNPFVDSLKKSNLVIDALQIDNKKICSGIEILAKAGRLKMLPQVLSEISSMFAMRNQSYTAFLYSNTSFSAEMIEKIAHALSKKLGIDVSIIERKWDHDGIKCVLEDLDLEVSFSRDMFVGNLKKYILDTFKKGVQVED